MFYCNNCANQYDYPKSYTKSIGKCELCGVLDECNNVPSSLLPMPKKQNKSETGK